MQCNKSWILCFLASGVEFVSDTEEFLFIQNNENAVSTQCKVTILCMETNNSLKFVFALFHSSFFIPVSLTSELTCLTASKMLLGLWDDQQPSWVVLPLKLIWAVDDLLNLSLALSSTLEVLSLCFFLTNCLVRTTNIIFSLHTQSERITKTYWAWKSLGLGPTFQLYDSALSV